MFVVPDEQPNRISRLLLGRGKFRPLVARYDQIESVAPGRVRLTTDESALELYHPNEAWLAVTPHEAERLAKAYLRLSEPANWPQGVRGVSVDSFAERSMPNPTEDFET